MPMLLAHSTKRRWPRRGVLAACLFCPVAGGGCDSSDSVSEKESPPDSNADTYANPVMARDFPDPTVIEGGDGAYYAYATETAVNGQFTNIQVARSENLVDWTYQGEALPGGVPWAQQRRQYWAPHVIHDSERSQYVLFHSARNDTTGGHCISVAVADAPTGPFEPEEDPLRCGSGFQVIDAMAFDDPESGRHLLYWGSEGQPIRVQEMTDDWRRFAPDSEPQEVLQPAPDEEYGSLIEGAWVIFRGGTYYLFVSGDNCCGSAAHYAVMVARSQDPAGPFEYLADATGQASSVILEANATWRAPGHNSIVQDDAGNDWMVYHAINRSRPTRDPGFGDGIVWDRRVMLMDRLRYENGWPYVQGRTPSASAERPVIEE